MNPRVAYPYLSRYEMTRNPKPRKQRRKNRKYRESGGSRQHNWSRARICQEDNNGDDDARCG
jgi:hypothetical protein